MSDHVSGVLGHIGAILYVILFKITQMTSGVSRLKSFGAPFVGRLLERPEMAIKSFIIIHTFQKKKNISEI